jgi:hypothetical protein
MGLRATMLWQKLCMILKKSYSLDISSLEAFFFGDLAVQ